MRLEKVNKYAKKKAIGISTFVLSMALLTSGCGAKEGVIEPTEPTATISVTNTPEPTPEPISELGLKYSDRDKIIETSQVSLLAFCYGPENIEVCYFVDLQFDEESLTYYNLFNGDMICKAYIEENIKRFKARDGIYDGTDVYIERDGSLSYPYNFRQVREDFDASTLPETMTLGELEELYNDIVLDEFKSNVYGIEVVKPTPTYHM